MGLSYSVRFQTDERIDVVASEISQALDWSIDPAHCGRVPLIALVTLVATDFELDVKEADEIIQTIAREDLGIVINKTAQVLVWSTFSTELKGGKQLTELVKFLMERYNGDLVFLFNDELILLIRIKQQVILNSLAGFWNDTNKLMIQFPYTEKPLRVDEVPGE